MADHGYTEHTIEAMVAALDRNHDGLITWHDFRTGWAKGQLRRRMRELHPELRQPAGTVERQINSGLTEVTLAGRKTGVLCMSRIFVRSVRPQLILLWRTGTAVTVRHGHTRRHHVGHEHTGRSSHGRT